MSNMPCGHPEDIALRIRIDGSGSRYCLQCLVDEVGLKSVRQQEVEQELQRLTKDEISERAEDKLGVEISTDLLKDEMVEKYVENV